MAETAEQTPQTVDGGGKGGDTAQLVATIVMFAFLLASVALVAYSLMEHGIDH